MYKYFLLEWVGTIYNKDFTIYMLYLKRNRIFEAVILFTEMFVSKIQSVLMAVF